MIRLVYDKLGTSNCSLLSSKCEVADFVKIAEEELISEEIIIDCVLNMMEIYEHLETEDSMFTLDYKSGVSISNCVGKRQRGIIKKKIDFVTSNYL